MSAPSAHRSRPSTMTTFWHIVRFFFFFFLPWRRHARIIRPRTWAKHSQKLTTFGNREHIYERKANNTGPRQLRWHRSPQGQTSSLAVLRHMTTEGRRHLSWRCCQISTWFKGSNGALLSRDGHIACFFSIYLSNIIYYLWLLRFYRLSLQHAPLVF